MTQRQKLRYRMKPGVGPHYYEGKKYVSGQIIRMYPEQTENIKNKLEPLDQVPDLPEKLPLKLVQREDGKYDVINEGTGNPINDVPLSLKESMEMVGDRDDDKKVEVQLQDDEPPSLKAVHRGGGRYLLVDTETEEPITDAFFKKDDANAIINGEKSLEEVLGNKD